MTDWREYASQSEKQWENTRVTMVGEGFAYPIFEQDRWLANAGPPAC